jgi:hypothetical protein
MFYRKNLAGWERALRAAAGVAMVGCGLVALQGLAVGYLIAAAGVLVAATGFLGFCPACAMAGRRLTRAE